MILDRIYWVLVKIIEEFGILSIPLIIGIGQSFGIPTEVMIPTVFNKLGPLVFPIVWISDVLSFVILFYIYSPFALRINLKEITKLEMALYRLIPVIRGGSVPIASRKGDIKEYLPVVLVTSFIWTAIFYVLSLYLTVEVIEDVLRRFEPVLLIGLAALFFLKLQRK